jgi:hypothetical protein
LCNIKFSCLADKKFFARWLNYFSGVTWC